MSKLTFNEVIKIFQDYNKRIGLISPEQTTRNKPVTAIIVYKESNFEWPATVKERSYRIRSDSSERFFEGLSNRAMYGTSLNGDDPYCRLDLCGWEIEYCYLENNDEEENNEKSGILGETG